MKAKILILVLLSAVLTACGGTVPPKILVAYYSQSGNTRAVAEQIGTRFQVDLYEITLATPYPAGEAETIAVAGQQREAGTLPEVQNVAEVIADYDIIFLGSPIWFGAASLPMMSFVASHDFTGKTVVPFYTCGGGDAGTFLSDITPHLDGATILPVFGNNRAERSAGTHIAKAEAWLDGLQF